MNPIRRLSIAAAASAVALGLGLGAATASAQEQFNARFSWKMKGEYGPMFTALERGYYKAEGLNVRYGEGAGAPAALAGLLQGQEDVVILPGVFALSAITKGMPIKLIALYHPSTPVVLVSYPDKPIRTPKDLEGKVVAHSVGETGTTYLDLFCKINNVDCGKVKKVTVNAQSRVGQFVQRQVDTVSVYLTNDLPIMQRTQKTDFVVLDMAKYGMVIPGMAVVSSDALIAKKPDALKRYLKATGLGVRDTKRNNEDAVRALMKNWPGSPDAGVIAAQVKATADYIPESFGKPIGFIDEKVISGTLDMMKGVGEIDAPKPLPTYYTNSLL